jgi:TolB-like protein/Tfp pilus assembly protein PilF
LTCLGGMNDRNGQTSAAVDLSSDRLSSWKEIAAYFKSGVRTVQRWERLEGLPVHRHQHQKAGTVYANKSELDAWWKDRQRQLAHQDAAPTPEASQAIVSHPAVSALNTFGLPRRLALAAVVMGLFGVATHVAWRLSFPKAKARVTLAVLPFTNLSGDTKQDYFSDGLTEETITQLGRWDPDRLGVIARTLSMKYKQADMNAIQIGKELGVDYILEGSVRRSGDQVRVSAQLIQVSNQTHLWAQSYELQIGDVLSAQEEFARLIGGEIRANLNGQRVAKLPGNRPVSAEAHEAYLKGRYFWNKRDEEDLRKGIEYFQEAVTRDPNYAAAYAGLADCYILLGLNGSAPQEVMPKATAATFKALEIDDSLAEAHTSLAGVKTLYEWDWGGAEQEFKRALELDPNYAPAHHWYANIYLDPQGRYQEAIAEMELAQRLDPVNLIIGTDLGYAYYLGGQDDKALAQYEKVLEMNPDFVPAHFRLWQYYQQKGLYKEAMAEAEKDYTLSGRPDLAAAAARAYATGGYRNVLQHSIEAVKAQSPRYAPLVLAASYATLGENDLAIGSLEKAYERRDPALIYLKADPFYARLRSDPRSQAVLRAVGLQP